MQEKTMLFLYNPWAGKREIVSQLHKILDYFVKKGFRITVRPTQRDNDAYHITRKYGQNYDYIVCSGGDGTLNETIHGMMEIQGELPLLGYLPAGSTNDFAASLKLPPNLLEAAKVVAKGRPKAIDIGQLEKRYFSYVAAFGLFTDVPYDTSQSMKNVFGHTAYVLEGVKRLANIKAYPCKVVCGEETFQDNFILGMVTNSASVGGFKLSPNVTNDERDFHLILLKAMPNLLDYAGSISTLLGKSEPGPQFIIRKTNGVKISSPNPIPWTLDGEYGGQYTHNEITVHPKSIRIMIPEERNKNDKTNSK